MEWVLHFDGGIWPNPGGTPRYGFVLETEDGDPIAQGAGKVPGYEHAQRTNNTAEFYALLMGLRAASSVQFSTPESVRVVGDSQLAVGVGEGTKRAKKEHLAELAALIHGEVAALRAAGVRVAFRWVPRERNARADALAGVARV